MWGMVVVVVVPYVLYWPQMHASHSITVDCALLYAIFIYILFNNDIDNDIDVSYFLRCVYFVSYRASAITLFA